MDQPSSSGTSPALRSSYALLTYLLTLPLMGWFGVLALRDIPFQWSHLIYQLCAWLALGAAPMLPAWLCAAIGGDPQTAATHKARIARWCCWALAGLLAGLATALLLVDIGIHRQFGFHFNGLVLNLLTTPGGFESMGLDYRTIAPAALALALVFAFHLALALRFPANGFLRRLANRFAGRTLLSRAWPALPIGSLVAAMLIFGVAEFYQNNLITSATDTYPIPVQVRMRKFLKRLGCTPPPRTARQGHEFRSKAARLNYPWAPVERTTPEQPLDIIWLVGESLRADLLSPERMPNTWRFAEESGIRFTSHYSGGNGTRPGMFSMFYSLHANAWDNCLNNNRGPLFFDWLIADHYQLLAQTSAKFTYPEFDRTVFAAYPQECLIEQSVGKLPPWQRDINAIDTLLAALDDRDPNRPFFGFVFFESTHAPYTFPPDQTPFQPYEQNLNYANVSAEDRELLYNRDANAAHHVDAQVGRLLDYLREHDRLDHTIVVITGDHGEEFFEHGRLGHNSTFVHEQTSPVLVMHFPGIEPSVYEGLSHHTDIVPTIAPWLGVTSPAGNYATGGNLLDPGYRRDFFLVFGWDTAVFANRNGKLFLPISFKSSYTRNPLTTFDDQPNDDVDAFYRENAAQIQAANAEMMRPLTR